MVKNWSIKDINILLNKNKFIKIELTSLLKKNCTARMFLKFKTS